MRDQAYAVIMAGGRGERFWPLSTTRRPKQLLPLFEKPLLTMAVDRLAGVIPVERVFVITNADLVDATRAAAPVLPKENVIGEPVGRDTAAACALGAALVGARCPDGVFCVLTADQLIEDLALFHAVLRDGLTMAAKDDVIITIGIQPTEPRTGFGYIEAGEPIAGPGTTEFRVAQRFVEKPNRETAERYLASGRFFWNSGMFMWSVGTLRNALGRFAPGLRALSERIQAAAFTPSFETQLRAEYAPLERISVDYAIMEKADNVVVARGVFRWDDVGSWPALADHFEKDAADNVIIGDGVSVEASRNVVYSRDRLTAVMGVSDLVIVQAEGVTMVCPRDRAQDIKRLVQKVRESPRFQELI